MAKHVTIHRPNYAPVVIAVILVVGLIVLLAIATLNSLPSQPVVPVQEYIRCDKTIEGVCAQRIIQDREYQVYLQRGTGKVVVTDLSDKTQFIYGPVKGRSSVNFSNGILLIDNEIKWVKIK